MTGTVEGAALRLNFNKHGAAPLVWSLHGGNFEIAVKGFRFYVPFESVYRPKATPDDDDGIPSAWLAPVQTSRVYRVTVSDGWATIQYENSGDTP